MSAKARTVALPFVAGISAAAAAASEHASVVFIDDALLRIIVPGIVLGFAGGVTAAIMPWGERTWGAAQGVKAVVLGIIVGSVSALVLADFTFLHDGLRMGLEFVAGIIAYQIVQMVQTTGPRPIVDWLLRRNSPPKQEPPSP